MTKPNYKEFADKFYKIMKSYPYTHTCELLDVIDEYEELHKPKMARYPNGGEYLVEVVNYDNKQYAIFWGNWYMIETGKLYQVRDDCVEELNKAYLEYQKTLSKQSKGVRL